MGVEDVLLVLLLLYWVFIGLVDCFGWMLMYWCEVVGDLVGEIIGVMDGVGWEFCLVLIM